MAICKPIPLVGVCQQEHGLLEGCQAACCMQLHLHPSATASAVRQQLQPVSAVKFVNNSNQECAAI